MQTREPQLTKLSVPVGWVSLFRHRVILHLENKVRGKQAMSPFY